MIYIDQNRPIEIIGKGGTSNRVKIKDPILDEIEEVNIWALSSTGGAMEIFNACQKAGICICNFKECTCFNKLKVMK